MYFVGNGTAVLDQFDLVAPDLAQRTALVALLALQRHLDERLKRYGRWFLGASCFLGVYIVWLIRTYPMPQATRQERRVVGLLWLALNLVLLAIYQEGTLNHLEELLVLSGGILGLLAVQHSWQEVNDSSR